MLSCKAYSFTVFCQKKCNHKKQKNEQQQQQQQQQQQKDSDIVFIEHLILHLLLPGVQTSWDCWNLPNKQF